MTARRLEDGLAGVILFARNIASTQDLARLCAAIREIKPDALIALDEEGGEVTRLEAATGSSWPGARVLGVVDDPGLTERAGRQIARALAQVGANVNLAPVADVATCARNPVIGNRSFGEDSALVARHVAAFVRGTQGEGVAACAKHFPGHGATTVDSHLDLPVVDLDLATLLADHVAPFAAAVRAGAAMLMTAHVLYPCLDDRPATASRAALHDLARRELGFDGVIATDALTMGAIARHLGVAAGAIAALGAGADLLCLDGDCRQQDEVIAGLRRALSGGELALVRVQEASERVAGLAEAYAPTEVSTGAAAGTPGATAPATQVRAGHVPATARATGLEAARRALASGPLPGPLPAAPYVVEATTARTGVGDVHSRLLDALRRRDPSAQGMAFTADGVPSAATVLRAAGERPLVIGSRDAHRRPAQESLIADLLAARPDAVLVGLGSAADGALAAGRFIPARGAAPPNVDAVAEVLLPRVGIN